jgi:hypothetical protein
VANGATIETPIRTGRQTSAPLSAERLTRAIQNVPDRSRIDSSGFVREAFKSFKEEVKEILSRPLTTSAKKRTAHLNVR